MPVEVRPAAISDLDRMVELLLLDAERRNMTDAILWKLKPDARERVTSIITTAMEDENPPFRQQWLLAEVDGTIVGLTHTILLPVPPIYAGEFGAPGLIMEDCHVAENAPAETAAILLKEAEADLLKAGAKVLLAASIAGGAWEAEYSAQNYEPLTLYYAKTGLATDAASGSARKATETDVPPIVALSARNRQVLFGFNQFWKPHPEADPRFRNWMKRSLTLSDRDMLVSGAEGEAEGYAIAQPATSLHFPPMHDIGAIGFIDDFFHTDFEEPAQLDQSGQSASDLLATAEIALAERQNEAVLIVCPAAWMSKRALLEAAGHDIAVVWHIAR